MSLFGAIVRAQVFETTLSSMMAIGLDGVLPAFIDSSNCILRRRAIRWLLEISRRSGISSSARDSAVATLDRFLSVISDESPHLTTDEQFVSISAASALILATKVHEGKQHALNFSHFPDFPTSSLRQFETHLLTKIGFKIHSLATPSTFVCHLVELWPDRSLHSTLQSKAEALLAEFYVDTEATRYAPSTMAIAALILTFSVLRIDCATWLASVPDVCFPGLTARTDGLGFPVAPLDVDGCLARFQLSAAVRAELSPPPSLAGDSMQLEIETCSLRGSCAATSSASPTSVTACPMDDDDVGVAMTTVAGAGEQDEETPPPTAIRVGGRLRKRVGCDDASPEEAKAERSLMKRAKTARSCIRVLSLEADLPPLTLEVGQDGAALDMETPMVQG